MAVALEYVGTGDQTDDALGALGAIAGAAPKPCAELDAAVRTMGPVRTRSPISQAAIIGAVSIAYAGALLFLFEIRPDLEGLPRGWVIAYGSAFLVSFPMLLWLSVVPSRGQVLPRWRLAAIGTAVACIAFPTAGLVFAFHVPGVSVLADSGVGRFFSYAQVCWRWGVVTALVPVALTAFVLRGAVPVQCRWVAAAIGAAGGALGGAVLHFHCPVADRWHVGLAHGGVVVIGALLSALIIPRVVRP